MIRQSATSFRAILVLGLIATGSAVEAATLARVSWMQGCWEAASPKRTIEENWTTARGHTMIGISRTVRGDSLYEYELMVLKEEGDRLAYHAHPSGQPSAVFLSKELSDSLVVFENPEHDFPQRVGYRRVGTDSLVAWIEGTRGGLERRVEFPYRRARCVGR
jgi:hypothetical protein